MRVNRERSEPKLTSNWFPPSGNVKKVKRGGSPVNGMQLQIYAASRAESDVLLDRDIILNEAILGA